ncbi:MAG: FG-GAP repeat protein [Anaerolineae bacterium]|nr:FG-GAP repeat protein [Anaerolineae bacterium]
MIRRFSLRIRVAWLASLLALFPLCLALGTASADTLVPPLAWTYGSGQTGSKLGAAVTGAGDVNGDGIQDLLIGAPNGTSPATSATSEGVVFVFYGSPSGLPSEGDPDQILSWGENGAEFGYAIAGGEDMNNDGIADVLVGAPGYKPAGQNGKYGAVFLYYGSETGLSTSPDWTFAGAQKESRLGQAVSFAGNLNGDDWDDIIVGAPAYEPDALGGAAFVFYGGPTGPITQTMETLSIGQKGARFGEAVSGVGDVNGDGFADVAIGAPNYDNTLINEGAVFLYHGATGAINTTVAWQDFGGQEDALYGRAVNSVGDVNGDKLKDIAMSAPYYDGKFADQGLVRVFHGSDQGLSPSSNWSFKLSQAFARFGTALSSAGDVNGDGYGDLIVGAPSYGMDEVGQANDLSEPALIFLGSASGIGDYWAWRLEEGQAVTDFGSSVGTAGDINSDGLDDVLVGAPGFKIDGQQCGKAFLYLGTDARPLPHKVHLPLTLRQH